MCFRSDKGGVTFLYCVSGQIKEVLKMDDQIHSLAQELYQQKSLLVMGRGYNYATCLEGALVSTKSKMKGQTISTPEIGA